MKKYLIFRETCPMIGINLIGSSSINTKVIRSIESEDDINCIIRYSNTLLTDYEKSNNESALKMGCGVYIKYRVIELYDAQQDFENWKKNTKEDN